MCGIDLFSTRVADTNAYDWQRVANGMKPRWQPGLCTGTAGTHGQADQNYALSRGCDRQSLARKHCNRVHLSGWHHSRDEKGALPAITERVANCLCLGINIESGRTELVSRAE